MSYHVNLGLTVFWKRGPLLQIFGTFKDLIFAGPGAGKNWICSSYSELSIKVSVNVADEWVTYRISLWILLEIAANLCITWWSQEVERIHATSFRQICTAVYIYLPTVGRQRSISARLPPPPATTAYMKSEKWNERGREEGRKGETFPLLSDWLTAE